MVAALGGLLFLAIVTITPLSYCKNVSNIEKPSPSMSQKLTTNYEESSTLRSSSIMIKNTTRCGPNLAKIVYQIIKAYQLPERNLLCILTDDEVKNDCFAKSLEEFLKLGTMNVISMVLGGRKFDSHTPIYQKPTAYFLLGVELSEIIEPLVKFGKIGGTWNPRGLYIGIAESKEEAAELMTSLWKRFVYKVVVLIYQNNTLDAVEAHTWQPYHPPNYCGPPTAENIIKLGRFTEKFQFKKETDTEPGMLPEKFGNCPLNISYNIWEPYVYPREEDQDSAIEVKLIEMICEKIEVKIVPNYHSLLETKEPGEAWAGTRIPWASDLIMYEISVPYIQDNLVWIVPCCDEMQVFEITHDLPYSLWVLSALAMIVASVSLMVSGEKYWILLVWGSLLEQSDYKVGKKIRGIWACWLLLCLHLSVAYKTALVSHLTDPSSKDDVQTQSDLLESGLELGFISEAEIYFNEEDEVERKILERHVRCETVIKCYKEITTGKAVFTNKMYANYLNRRKDDIGSIGEKVRQLPTSLTYKVSMIYAKGHAVLPSFDKYLLDTSRAGFIQYWINEIEETQKKIDTHRLLNFTKEKRLSFAHVRGGFNFLRTGLAVAGLTFLYEIISRKIFFKLKNISVSSDFVLL